MADKINEAEIYSKIQNLIYEAIRVDREKITREARLFTDLGAESLDVLDIRFRIEQLFGFKIKEGDIVNRLGDNLSTKEIEEKFTVQSIVEYVKERCE